MNVHACDYASSYSECEGEVTLGPDPYKEEINGDLTPYWLCWGHYFDLVQEI